MAHESFEDQQVADMLNEHFVSIKVDREERPDIDHVYMTVCQALTGQGGWPLTVVMTPAQKPFFAGTYFPKHTKYGRMGMLDLLSQLDEKWEHEQDRLLSTADKILEHVTPRFGSQAGDVDADALFEDAYANFVEAFDPRHGGFSAAPKFPVPHQLLFLFRYARMKGDLHAASMAMKTLDGMRAGGIYDHVGGGFSRYSTDDQWLVPHFEKMLYDNALLVLANIEAYQSTHEDRYREMVEATLAYVLRDMQSPEGGFYSAEDADSEGVEGRFYVWRPDDVIAVLGKENGNRYCNLYDITEAGNFEGYCIPNLIDQSLTEFARSSGLTDSELKLFMATSNEQLFIDRKRRIHPHKDDKILTAWNGLMIAALAKAGTVLGNQEYINQAARALNFLKTTLVEKQSGRLLARYRDGEASFVAYADDYAYVIWGLTELYQATFDASYLQWAVELQNTMIELFFDEVEGGFFLSGSDGEPLIARPKESYDGATPSGNSVAAYNLARLAKWTGQMEYMDKAEAVLSAFAAVVLQHPASYSFYLLALMWVHGKTKELVIVGDPVSEETQNALRMAQAMYLPDAILLFRPVSGNENTEVGTLPDVLSWLREYTAHEGRTTLYHCENFACQAPSNDWAQALEQLSK